MQMSPKMMMIIAVLIIAGYYVYTKKGSISSTIGQTPAASI
jgi:hypothetical protein